MSTAVATGPRRHARAVAAPLRRVLGHLLGDRVVQAAVLLIVVQLVYRGWATYDAWYHYDDFNFFSRMMNEGLSPVVASRQYAGHVMPGGMYLSWLSIEIAPYDFRVTATMLLLFQLLANVGLLVLLVRLFGRRAGILPPLAIYLFAVITVPVAIWWAAGVNQIPMQASLFWALACHVSYLRTRRLRHVFSTLAWLAFGFLFYEKTLLVFGAIALLTICYFTTGGIVTRIRQIAVRYWPALVGYGVLAVVYLAVYVRFGLTFSPDRAADSSLREVASNMAVQAYLPGIMGGSLRWAKFDQWALPTPGSPLVLASAVVAALVLRELQRSRRRSLRAWTLPLFFLGANILLVVAGRASFVGALISLDYRFQGEMSAVTAVALGLAALPVVGAEERVEVRGPSELLDHPSRVGLVTALISVLGLVSSTQYVQHWQQSGPAEAYFGTLLPAIATAEQPVPLLDGPVPPGVMWGLAYPENTLSHLLRPYPDDVTFPDVATDRLLAVTDEGSLEPVLIPPTRRALAGPEENCGYRVGTDPVTLPLDGPVVYGGFWVRIGYLATAAGPVRVEVGTARRTTLVQPGVHAMYVRAEGQFDEIRLTGLAPGTALCTDDVSVGNPSLEATTP